MPATRSFGGVAASWLVSPINPEVDDHEDGGQAQPRAAAQEWPYPDQRRGPGTEGKRDQRRLADGAGVSAPRSDPRKPPDQRAGPDQGPDGQASHRQGGHDARDPVVTVIGSRTVGASVRSIQPANRTQTAVATVIMLRLCSR